MVATPYPLPRETRESAVLVGNGTVGPYGPSTYKIFDLEDVSVFAKALGATLFSDVTDEVTITKTSGLPFDTFSVTFDTSVPATTQWYHLGVRTAERSLAVTKAGTIDTDQLERELSKIAVTQSEQRRDLDNATGAEGFAAQAEEFAAAAEAASLGDIAAAIHAATNKATPTGADELGIWDSVSTLFRRLNLTNLKNWLFTGPLSFLSISQGTLLTLESTNSGAVAGPNLVLYRNSASPAAADGLGAVVWTGKDSAAADHVYAQLQGSLIDPVNGTEDGSLAFDTSVAGTLATRMTVGQGLAMAGATGGDKGAGSVNGDIYDAGNRMADVVLASGTVSAVANLSISLAAHIAAGFTEFELRLKNFVPVTDNQPLYLTLSTNAGSSYISSGYRSIYAFGTPSPATGASGSNSAAQITLIASCGNVSGEFVTQKLGLTLGAIRASIITETINVSEASATVTVSGGGVLESANVNALRVAFGSGNISSGTWTLIGKRSA